MAYSNKKLQQIREDKGVGRVRNPAIAWHMNSMAANIETARLERLTKGEKSL